PHHSCIRHPLERCFSLHVLRGTIRPRNSSRSVSGPSLCRAHLLLTRVHAWGTRPTVLARLHLLLSSILFQFHNQRLHGPHLHANRKNNLQDNPDLPANLTGELSSNPVRESSSAPNSRNSSPVRRLRQRHSPNIGSVCRDSSRIYYSCHRGRRSLFLVLRHSEKDQLEIPRPGAYWCIRFRDLHR